MRYCSSGSFVRVVTEEKTQTDCMLEQFEQRIAGIQACLYMYVVENFMEGCQEPKF